MLGFARILARYVRAPRFERMIDFRKMDLIIARGRGSESWHFLDTNLARKAVFVYTMNDQDCAFQHTRPMNRLSIAQSDGHPFHAN